MVALVTPSQSSHWYTRDGKPFHTIVGANGKERDTTLRDARKLGLFPSVTSVLSVIGKPALNAWISEQAILAALTLPREKDETDQDFAARCVKDMDRQRDDAASLGRKIHDAIDDLLSERMPDPVMTPYLASLSKWFDEVGLRPLAIESDCVSKEHGFGGRLDLYGEVTGRTALIDFKSQNVKNGKPNFYETWPLQLAAYRKSIHEDNLEVSDCYSVIVDVNLGQPIHVKKWTNEELDFKVFEATFRLWKYIKGYDPLEVKS